MESFWSAWICKYNIFFESMDSESWLWCTEYKCKITDWIFSAISSSLVPLHSHTFRFAAVRIIMCLLPSRTRSRRSSVAAFFLLKLSLAFNSLLLYFLLLPLLLLLILYSPIQRFQKQINTLKRTEGPCSSPSLLAGLHVSLILRVTVSSKIYD